MNPENMSTEQLEVYARELFKRRKQIENELLPTLVQKYQQGDKQGAINVYKDMCKVDHQVPTPISTTPISTTPISTTTDEELFLNSLGDGEKTYKQIAAIANKNEKWGQNHGWKAKKKGLIEWSGRRVPNMKGQGGPEKLWRKV